MPVDEWAVDRAQNAADKAMFADPSAPDEAVQRALLRIDIRLRADIAICECKKKGDLARAEEIRVYRKAMLEAAERVVLEPRGEDDACG